MKYSPRNITLKNVIPILQIFGLTGHIVVKGQGWARCYVQYVPQAWPLDPNPIPLQFGRIMFERGKFSHFNFYLDPQGRIHDTMFYEVALQVFQRTGLELDAPAWSDLVARATQRAEAEAAVRKEKRSCLPKKAKRRKLAPPNYAYALMKELERDLSELFEQDFQLCL